jgi:hypothetical protein
MHIYIHSNVGKVYLSCVSTFSSCASNPNSHGLALWKEHRVLLPEQPCDCQKPLGDNCTALTLS